MFKLSVVLISFAFALATIAPWPSDAMAQGMARKPDETSRQCVRRLFPKGYNRRILQHCIKACVACYTTSGGAKCESYCLEHGAR
jgi:hypothetical protein